MISLTPYGSKVFQKATERIPASVHLYVDSGELVGYGYEPKMLKANEWIEGQYPELMWEFSSENQPADVLGYYVSDAEGQVLFSSQFDKPNRIKNQGDRIGVSINMRWIGAIGG